MNRGAMYTKSALDAYAWNGDVGVAQPRGKVGREEGSYDQDAPKRNFIRPVGDGTRLGARRIVQKVPKLFSGRGRKSRVVEVDPCPVAQKHRLSQTYDKRATPLSANLDSKPMGNRAHLLDHPRSLHHR
jgi:hypothetical protein